MAKKKPAKTKPKKTASGLGAARPGFTPVRTGTPIFTPAPAAAPPPPAPAPIAPFLTAEDLLSINDFNTNWKTNLAGVDSGIASLATDTRYQKTQNDKQAKSDVSDAADVMAARGLFRSSLKDAAMYDIEANRSLANKFLDDKLTEAQLAGGTQKKILADSKLGFDTALQQKMVANAQGVNDSALEAWSQKMATWVPPKPQVATNTYKAAKPLAGAVKGGTTSRPNVAQGTGSTTPRKVGTVKPKVTAGIPKPPKPPKPRK